MMRLNKYIYVFALFLFFLGCFVGSATAQKPTQQNSADILHAIKKLNVLGTVLYVAAHPDDENTRLLAYMAKGRQYRTGYLALTRGDGGQNLIGDEQGVELGLIRTQELLAARRVDGAEQFFSRAFDFGYSKSTEETLLFWDHEKVLSDAVWVIRKFRPDIIITRFPEDNRAGHGHHSASAVIAHEAFVAAADPKRFPEQFNFGVTPWQAKRIMWNTFSFGGNNTTAENQLKIDVGDYIPLIGKSIGEIAGESRSNHRSQGFGSSLSRGQVMEYFDHIRGDKASTDPMESIDCSWKRVSSKLSIEPMVVQLINGFDMQNPAASIPQLISIRKKINGTEDIYWKQIKLAEVDRLIQLCAGLHLEALTTEDYAVQGDTLNFAITMNNRSSVDIKLKNIHVGNIESTPSQVLKKNQNWTQSIALPVSLDKSITQPYWLEREMNKGSFNVDDQKLIGLAENPPLYEVHALIDVLGEEIVFSIPVQHKHVDPAKGEVFQPIYVVPPISVLSEPAVFVVNKNNPVNPIFKETIIPNTRILFDSLLIGNATWSIRMNSPIRFESGYPKSYSIEMPASEIGNHVEKKSLILQGFQGVNRKAFDKRMRTIQYDHIPTQHYFITNTTQFMPVDLKTAGSKIGYVAGAGDKVPAALTQMGFNVTMLSQDDIVLGKLNQFDAVVMGIRAYNVHEWLEQKHDILMDYVRQGGNMVVQYNTSNNSPFFRDKIGPKSFSISRGRVTEEDAAVSLFDDADPILNFPNKITKADFSDWIQERGIYFAENFKPNYRSVLSMHDKNESALDGSLIVCNEGKGRFIYTGLVFFRELPAGVPGSFRLFANIISNPNKKMNESK